MTDSYPNYDVLLQSLRAGKSPPKVCLLFGDDSEEKKRFVSEILEILVGTSQEHPDVHWLSPEGKSALYTVASIRDMISETVTTPFLAPYKIYILQSAERMAAISSNALLKLLEEPPPFAVFLLLVEDLEGVLPTIESRCLCLSFCRQKEKTKTAVFQTFSAILSDYFLHAPPAPVFDVLELEDASQIEPLFEQVLLWVRDLHYLQVDAEGMGITHIECLQALKKQSDMQFPTLERVFALVNEARTAIHRSMKAGVVLEQLFYSCSLSI